MAAGYDIEESAPTLEDALQVLDQFLAGQVHQDAMLAILTSVVADDSSAAHPLQEQIDSALLASELSEPVWERITEELDRVLSEDAPTEWPEDDAAAPEPVDSVADSAMPDESSETESEPPVLEDRVTTATPAHATPATEIPPGTLLGDRYVIVSRANTGGMGSVYKALDRTRKEAGDANPWVAVKVLGKDFASHPQALQTLEQEAEHCRSLDHEHIVRVFDFECEGETCFLTMEWLEGESLMQLLERTLNKPPSAKQLRRIILSVGSALAHAHAMGVTHADVKPGNIFVTHAGDIKLLDFGAAHSKASGHEASIQAKTPAYSSCEILEGETPEPRDDLFSYALLIYRLLAGRPAFWLSNALEAEAENMVPERVPRLGDQAWTTLAQAMEFRRADRPADVATFLEAFTAPPKSRRQHVATDTAQTEAPKTSTEEPPVSEPPRQGDQAASEVTAEAPLTASAPGDEDIDPNADTGILPAHVPESARATASWIRPTLIAASLLACAGAAWWLWPGEPGSLTVAKMPATTRTSVLPSERAKAEATTHRPPVANHQSQMGALFPIELDDQAADDLSGDRSEGEGTQPNALAKAEPGLEAIPKPDAQLASIAAAPAVSPQARDAGATARLPAEPAIRPEAKAKARSEPKPAPTARPQPKPELEKQPVTTGTVADTTAKPRSAAAPALARTAAPAATAAPAPPSAAGGVASAGPPASDMTLANPGDYGPAPAAAPSGPPEVAMSELNFARFVEPRYPRSRTARKTRGWAEVEFQVNPEGETTNIRILESSPAELFDEPAMAAVEKWRFKPFVVDGEAIAVTSVIRLRFEPQR